MPSPLSAEATALMQYAARPPLALSIVDLQNPYEEVQLRGRVVERPFAHTPPRS